MECFTSCEQVEVGDVVWGLRYGKRVPAVVVDFEEVPKARQKQIKSRKVSTANIQNII